MSPVYLNLVTLLPSTYIRPSSKLILNIDPTQTYIVLDLATILKADLTSASERIQF